MELAFYMYIYDPKWIAAPPPLDPLVLVVPCCWWFSPHLCPCAACGPVVLVVLPPCGPCGSRPVVLGASPPPSPCGSGGILGGLGMFVDDPA